MSIKYAYLTIASKCPVIIRILFLLVIYKITTILYKKLYNSFISKYKTKIILIIHIIKARNNSKCNIK